MTAQPVGNAVEVRGNVTGQPLAVVATVARKDEGIEISGFVRNNSTTPATRSAPRIAALQLSYTLPQRHWLAVGRHGARVPHLSRRRELLLREPAERADAPVSVATVFDTTSGISIGHRSAPRARTRCATTAKGLTITFDLGTSRSATLLNGRADFRSSCSAPTRRTAKGRRGLPRRDREVLRDERGVVRSAAGHLPKREGIPFYSRRSPERTR
jgi:hypothetical protein